MFRWQAERLAQSITIFRARYSMRFVRPFDFRDALADERMRDDELRFPVIALLCDVQCVENLLHVVAIDLLNIKSVCFKTFAGVFALCLFGRSIERDGIRIVDEDQIIQTPMASERASLRRY